MVGSCSSARRWATSATRRPGCGRRWPRADIVAAEDTRRLGRLARDLDIEIAGRIVSYFEGNEERRTPELAEALLGGATVAVVTDGGMPSVSDPGYRLVRAAIDAGVPVTAAPGPSAVTTALAALRPALRPVLLRGLPAAQAGRAPGPAGRARRPRSARWCSSRRRTGSPRRWPRWPRRSARTAPAAVCRELTKTYEEVRRAPLAELATWAADGEPRGEITLVVGGAPAAVGRPSDGDLLAAVAAREAAGTPRKDAIAEVAKELGLPKRDVYNLVVAARVELSQRVDQ